MVRSKKEKRKIDRLKQRILDSLKDKAELSNNRGVFERNKYTKPNRKTRRHSGRYTPGLHQKGKFSEMIANAEEPKEEYDEWSSYRDGYRNINCDRTHFFIPRYSRYFGFFSEEDVRKFNKKIKKQIAIRKAKKRKF
jgi:hypothetical protein